jgi:PhzF family phenazine biosynthesis protein
MALRGNPLAVVVDAEGLDEGQMAAFARWTNLSETTFLLPPSSAEADYRVRIFTPSGELPFAGHPTLGSCHVWLAAGGRPQADVVVQECAVGLVRVRRQAERLAFAAPPLRRTGPVEQDLLARIVSGLGLTSSAVLASQWVDNGPGWVAVMLGDRSQVLALQPDYAALGGIKLGVVAPWVGGEAQFEVRAFVGASPGYEDPVTGSLNASLAQWMMASGLAPQRYVASQGTVLQRSGRVHLERDGDTVWVGGEVTPCVEGNVLL